jgi:hypothetical protein
MTDNYAEYLNGRKKYSRPQAMLWADNSGTFSVRETSSITAVTPSNPAAGSVKYTAANNFAIGDFVNISGLAPDAYNGTYAITGVNPTYFIVTNVTTTTVTDAIGIAGKASYVPTGTEINSNDTANNFIILSDDNRAPIDFTQQRIENRRRTVNGRMRSYHTADKLQISVSWDMLPSRSFSNDPNFNLATGAVTTTGYSGLQKTSTPGNYLYQFTTDGGAGGAEILDWYENNKGSFWVYLSYDKYPNFENAGDKYKHLAEYSQVLEMFISDFSYSVVKRGGTNFDFWNISVTLEEA